MPAIEDTKISSWADEVDETSEDLPPPSEVIDNGLKIVTVYRRNEDGKKEKLICTYKTEKRVVSKTVAFRKTWKKYGASANDKPGPNPATTIAAEETFMQFITSKEDHDKPDDDLLEKLRGMADKTVKCRTCNGDHWTLKCPFKDTGYMPTKVNVPPALDDKKNLMPMDDKNKPSKYIPPYMRDGAKGRGDAMGHRGQRDDSCAIRLSNLSESTQEVDLEELVRPFGDYSKLFLAKDKNTGACKGFAYIHFKHKLSAANAIAFLDGHGYDHLILAAEWSKPQVQQH
ncbi:Very-long-chain 3-oxoacyl-CoA reductase [Nesidiocoris tenuis]|uniref:Eukaryotic translation initiation factor 3 subunit G n=1 Tax=Nesidiocoris tenuis TaxID=355587 RepID=A0ABN7BA06_9HEMI|nr:Very-long-chain 3-oxoacyl-CoA reductase [Nesidiocoris tenuis]